MSALPPVTAVIPVHNRADLLARLLPTMQNQTVPFGEVIVVDNASTDGARTIARDAGCRIVDMGENAGFARAVNRGWQAASSPWIAILNSDVELDPEWLANLLTSLALPNATASFATGLILNATNRNVVDGTYDLVCRSGCAWRAGHGEAAPPAGSCVKQIAIAPGTACLFRREVLERLGGLDEDFGSYLEDIDLGLRCLRHGFAGIFVAAAVAWHHGSATLGRWNPAVVRMISRNQLLLVSRHYDAALFREYLWPILAGQILWGLVALRHGAAIPWLAGKWEGLLTFHLRGDGSAALRAFLAASEREIRARANDPYWRWYFRLAGPGSI